MEKNGLDFQEIFKFTKEQNEYLVRSEETVTQREKVLAQTTKLLEECGEFASEVMINLKICRKEKLRENSTELANEWADVMIVMFLLGERLGIDMEKALKNKIEIVKSRRKY